MRKTNASITYYGPHQCPRCQAMIVKAAIEQGGEEYDCPQTPAYPNTKWKRHDCPKSPATNKVKGMVIPHA